MRLLRTALSLALCLLCCRMQAQLITEKAPEPIQDWIDYILSWPQPRTDTISLYIVGDIMNHQAQINSALRHGKPDYSTFLYHIRDKVDSADIAICNMEYTLAGPPYSGYPSFCAPDEYTVYLRDLGFDVLLTANNHILDKGYKGLSRTFAVLDTLKGVQYTGMSRNQSEDRSRYPLMLECKGMRIAIINFTYNTNRRPTQNWPKINYMVDEDILAAMNRAKENGADLILAFPHWGTEYKFIHNQVQENYARLLIDNGANAVIGGHPHFVQDMEWMGDVPVFYSLGDVVSNMDRECSRLGLAVNLDIILKSGEKPRIAISGVEYLWNSRPGEVEESFSSLPIRKFLDSGLWRNKDAYLTMKGAYETTRNSTHIHEEDFEAGSR